MDKKDGSGPVVANLHYGGAYRGQLEAAARSGNCIFCGKRIQKIGVLYETRHWLIRHNQFPEKDSGGQNPEYHFLIISKTHLPNDCNILSGQHRTEIDELTRWARDTFKIYGGGLIHRTGDPIWSGTTILHFHIHFIVPRVVEIDGNIKAIPVYMPIG